jgi:hypothetical protein
MQGREQHHKQTNKKVINEEEGNRIPVLSLDMNALQTR